MSLATFINLRDGIANFTARPDFADSQVNAARTLEFISLAEARMNRDLARIAAGELVETAALTTSAEAIDLPADFNGMRFLAINGSSVDELRYKTPEVMYRDWASAAVGQPRAYTLHGKLGTSEVLQARFRPIPDAVYALIAYYYKKVATLIGGADGSSNWMLTNNPDCYLYAACIEAANWMDNEAQIAKWGKLYAQALEDVKSLDDARRVGSASPRASPGVGWKKGM